MHLFKLRNKFKCYKAHCESSDADLTAVHTSLPLLRNLTAECRGEDIFNTDELGIFYTIPPTTTIGPAPVSGRKKSKKRITLLLCTNSTGSEKLQPLVVGRPSCPRCFGGRTVVDLGFDYEVGGRAWMNSEIFWRWLERFDAYIARAESRKVALFIDNASCHRTAETIPILQNVRVAFLPKRTTSALQPLDLGVTASLKKPYRKKLSQRAEDLIESNHFSSIYRVDLKVAITWVYEV